MLQKESQTTPVATRKSAPAGRIVHVITGLGTGGAEMMLYKLLEATKDAPNRVLVISLTGDGPVGERIRSIDVPVRTLGMSAYRPNPLLLLQLSRWIRAARANVVQTWMYHADFIGGLAAKLADRRVPVIWNVRASNLDPAVVGAGARSFARLSALASGWLPEQIVTCSQAAAELHIANGYPRARVTVIPNGFDLAQYRPDPQAREEMRSVLGVMPNEVLIGLVARFHPMKDHETFIRAARQLHNDESNVRFVLCGKEMVWENAELVTWIEQAGLRERFLLLGERSDISRVNAGLDIASLTSRAAEGFPNVLGEAMACEVPCVATDVGDSALIVGETGRVVPPRDHVALAFAWRELIQMGPEGRRSLGQQARERVSKNFSLPAVAGQYEALYTETVTRFAP